MKVELIANWINSHEPQGKAKLSAAAEISVGTIERILKGKGTPDTETLLKLANVLEVRLEDLFQSNSNTRSA